MAPQSPHARRSMDTNLGALSGSASSDGNRERSNSDGNGHDVACHPESGLLTPLVAERPATIIRMRKSESNAVLLGMSKRNSFLSPERERHNVWNENSSKMSISTSNSRDSGVAAEEEKANESANTQAIVELLRCNVVRKRCRRMSVDDAALVDGLPPLSVLPIPVQSCHGKLTPRERAGNACRGNETPATDHESTTSTCQIDPEAMLYFPNSPAPVYESDCQLVCNTTRFPVRMRIVDQWRSVWDTVILPKRDVLVPVSSRDALVIVYSQGTSSVFERLPRERAAMLHPHSQLHACIRLGCNHPTASSVGRRVVMGYDKNGRFCVSRFVGGRVVVQSAFNTQLNEKRVLALVTHHHRLHIHPDSARRLLECRCSPHGSHAKHPSACVVQSNPPHLHLVPVPSSVPADHRSPPPLC
eukprot:ANDGO_03439.mRNA.1 hypothetical protein